MGSDDLFKKRKAKKLKDHQRKVAMRKPYDRVLIVCEGEKTEPSYFMELREYYGLHTANIEITGECGSSPTTILAKAKELFNKAKQDGNPFDRVYCIFDKDEHTTYEQTILEIENITPKGVFFSITSVPCFEYWILLHFTYSCKPFTSSGNKSAAEYVISELKNFYPDYEKNKEGIFIDLIDKLDTAIAYAKQISKSNQKTVTDNQSTSIGELVEYLRNLKL